MKTYLTAKEIAELQMKDWPATERGCFKRIKGLGIAGRKRDGSKAVEYRVDDFPKAMGDQIFQKMLGDAVKGNSTTPPLTPMTEVAVAEPAPANTQGVRVLPAPTGLNDKQRRVAEARLILVREVQRLTLSMGKTRAIANVVALAATGALPDSVQRVVVTANHKANARRTIGRRSLFDWCSLVDTAPEGVPLLQVLAPKAGKLGDIPMWAAPLMKLWNQPQKPSLVAVLETLKETLPAGVGMPSYAQAYRFIHERVGAVDRERGRMGARELKNIRPFVRRDTSQLWPTDIYTADGHCFDAEVAHPDHGQPFRPEVTAILDVATRRCVGWSVDLAENASAVLAALSAAAWQCGIPAMFYVDNGAGYNNDLFKNLSGGVMARLGCEMTHALPHNSQAKGIIERSHRSIWVKAAKKLPTYIGKDMDAEAKNKVFKITRGDIKATGTSKLLMSWPDFVAFCEQTAREYNARPHSALPTIDDADLGKKRHVSPDEAWTMAVDGGADIVRLTESERQDLYRPYVERTVDRGEIRLFSNLYFHKALEQFHGDKVLVGYEFDDAKHVWVRSEEGVLLAVADWRGNSELYFPQPVVEQNRQKRAAGRLKRLAAKQQEVLLEANPRQVLEHLEAQTVLPANFDAAKIFAQMNERPPVYAQVQAEVLPVFGGQLSQSMPMTGQPTTTTREILTLEQKLAKWQRLDAAVKNDVALTEKERWFWEMFPTTGTFKTAMELYNNQTLLAQGQE